MHLQITLSYFVNAFSARLILRLGRVGTLLFSRLLSVILFKMEDKRISIILYTWQLNIFILIQYFHICSWNGTLIAVLCLWKSVSKLSWLSWSKLNIRLLERCQMVIHSPQDGAFITRFAISIVLPEIMLRKSHCLLRP